MTTIDQTIARRYSDARIARVAAGVRRSPAEVLAAITFGTPYARRDAALDLAEAVETAADTAARLGAEGDYTMCHASAGTARALAGHALTLCSEHDRARAEAAADRAEQAYRDAIAARTRRALDRAAARGMSAAEYLAR